MLTLYINFLNVGLDLSKLIIKSIILIEKTGCQIIGITSNGLATNRNVWSILEVIF